MAISVEEGAVSPLYLFLSRIVGYPKSQIAPLLPDTNKCSMDPSMDSAGLTSFDSQSSDQAIVSLADNRSSFPTSEPSSSIITIDDTIPSPNWKLLEIFPTKVC